MRLENGNCDASEHVQRGIEDRGCRGREIEWKVGDALARGAILPPLNNPPPPSLPPPDGLRCSKIPAQQKTKQHSMEFVWENPLGAMKGEAKDKCFATSTAAGLYPM